MNLISVSVLGMNGRWSPAPFGPAVQGLSRRLAQAPGVPPPAAAPAPEPPSLFDIDGPFISFLSSAAAASSTAILGYSFGKANSRWSTVFWAASGITAFKALADLSRLK
jgi:hypothetical protein